MTEVTYLMTQNVADWLDRQSNELFFNLAESKSKFKAEVMTHDATRVKQLWLATNGKEVWFLCKRLGKKTLSWQTSEGNNRRSVSAGRRDNNDDDNINNGTQNP